MKRPALLRFITVISVSLAAGWMAGIWCFPAPSTTPPAAHPTAPGRTAADSTAPTALEDWLEQNAPPEPPADATAFWSLATGLSSQPASRQRLWLEAACLEMPWELFLAVVKDERFALFTAFGFDDGKTETWCRRLITGGTDTAIGLSGTLPNRRLNGRLDHALRRHLAQSDPDKGFHWLKDRKDSGNAIAQFLAGVASRDLSTATRLWHLLEAGKPADERERAVKEAANSFAASQILRTLSSKDWKTALAWADQNLSGPVREKNIASVFENLSRTGRKQVLAEAGEISDPALRSLAFSRGLSNGASSSDGLMVAALDLPAGSLDAKGWAHLGQKSAGFELRKKDVPAAAEKLRGFARLIPEAGRAGYLENAALMGLWNDRPLAGQLSEFLNVGSTGMLAEEWAAEDPTAASTWLAALPESEKRQAAIAAFCRGLAPVDPPSAAEWALSLQDGSARNTALRDSLEAWRKTDAAAANAWVLERKLDLPDPR